MTTDVSSVLKNFSHLKILIIGDVMLDEYLWGRVERISPEAPVPVVAIEKKESRLGGAANVAMNVKGLEAKPILCSVIGKDESGKALLKLLKKNHMSTEGIMISSERITSIKTRVLSKSHQLIRYDSEITSELSPEDRKKFSTVIRDLIAKEKPGAIIFEDYNKGVLTEKLIAEIISIARAKNILTAVDPKRKNFFAYKNADVFKPNLREVREALNHEVDSQNEASLQSAHSELKKKLQHKIAMITLGDHGIFFSDGKQSAIIPAHKRDVSDVSGAGDTVIAVATLALASGMKLNEAASIANLAGGLVCEYSGVVPVTREMMSKELNNIST